MRKSNVRKFWPVSTISWHGVVRSSGLRWTKAAMSGPTTAELAAGPEPT